MVGVVFYLMVLLVKVCFDSFVGDCGECLWLVFWEVFVEFFSSVLVLGMGVGSFNMLFEWYCLEWFNDEF